MYKTTCLLTRGTVSFSKHNCIDHRYDMCRLIQQIEHVFSTLSPNQTSKMKQSPKRCSLHYVVCPCKLFVLCVAVCMTVCIFKLITTETDTKIWVLLLYSCVDYLLPNFSPCCNYITSGNEGTTPENNEGEP